MKLSYSLIEYHLQPTNSHNWINRQLGRKMPENEAMKTGKEIHKLIQQDTKKYIGEDFLVETEDFDPKMHFEFEYGNYLVHGYFDGKNKSKILEIKSGTKFWSIMDFMKSKQLALYAFCNPFISEIVCITALSDTSLWTMQPPRKYIIPVRKQIIDSGRKYLNDAITLFEKGDFTGGLEDGVCKKWCSYGEQCYFKS